MARVSILHEAKDILGEGALWHPSEQRFYWTDIERGLLQSVTADGSDYRSHRFAERLGCFAFHADGSLILALESGFHSWAPSDAAPVLLARHGEPPGLTRMNDGKCDPAGRFLAGSLDLAFKQPIASLYALEHDGSCRRLFDKVCISNSLCWSPDGRRMYFADTPTRRIEMFDYDPAKGIPSNRRLFCDLTQMPGLPDGACISANGDLWVAMYDGGCLLRISAGGNILDRIELPCHRPTCCAFGGPDFRQVLITSASDHDIGGKQGGSLFSFRAEIPGLPMQYWQGLKKL